MLLLLLMVRAVGLEPTLFRTCPLNMRVCHSATLANCGSREWTRTTDPHLIRVVL